ncbi:sulfur carrier protein ThiS [Kiloniella sp.]|uniref:sulfur carrier protein ThiS n=1 Tax=Kiloniella sp. TaxID=1938587 RepID=UPI003B02C361
MNLTLNGEAIITKTSNLAALLEEQGYGEAKVATAVNGALAPASFRGETQLKDGDAIEVVAPMQGG